MLCRKPYSSKGAQFGCGQCMHCRINRRRLWAHRIILEAVVHPTASFVTLTYNDENIPDAGSLVPRHLTLFLKRIRERLAPRVLRHFSVGEYGDETERPHYHLALFNTGYDDHQQIQEAWPYGFVYLGDLTWDSAAYIAGYVTKKMTQKDDPRLQGRFPEFARMSLRPGIGALSVVQVAEALQNKHGWDEILRTGDVPLSLRHGRKNMPLGRYLRVKMREALEWEETGAQDNGMEAFKKSAEMLTLYQNYLIGAERHTPFAVLQERKRQQRLLNREVRQQIYEKKGTL